MVFHSKRTSPARLKGLAIIAIVIVYSWSASNTVSLLRETHQHAPSLSIDDSNAPPPITTPELASDEGLIFDPIATETNVSNRTVIPSILPPYTKELARQAIRPVPWTCGDRYEQSVDPLTNQKPIFSFVHIYKTAGSTLRAFFLEYASTCKKSWMGLIGCTGVSSSSIQSGSVFDDGEEQNWNKCRVKTVLDRRHHIYEREETEERVYPTVNNTILRENFDIYGGHFRIGTGDYIFSDSVESATAAPVHPVRHIVFLRSPMERFVSGILYQDKRKSDDEKSLEQTAKMIKKRVRGSRKANQYWDTSLSYLLTPKQVEMFGRLKSSAKKIQTTKLTWEEHFAETKARIAIQNLIDYNPVIGMTETMKESMNILQHVFVNYQFYEDDKEELESDMKELFDKYTPDDTKGVRQNESRNGAVSTTSVLQELKQDAEFMLMFGEYVKYETMITDYAMRMHLVQHEMVTEGVAPKQQSATSA